MNLLAISGSVRASSLNGVLLRAIAEIASPEITVKLCPAIDALPIFNADLEGQRTPVPVIDLCSEITHADGIIVSSPEYVRSIPGGLKNAIDWLVSREEIISKPIAIAHASYRGDDMLDSLRLVLGTVSDRFADQLFLRIPLQSHSPVTVEEILDDENHVRLIRDYLEQFNQFINQT